MVEKVSKEQLLEISRDLSIQNFKDLEELYGITQKYLFGRLYINKDILPQSVLDELRHFYKTLAKNSGVGVNPYIKKQKIEDSAVTISSVWVNEPGIMPSVIDVEDSEDEYEGRVTGESVRDCNGRIKEYRYKILVRDKDPIEGTLTPNQMQTLYFQYSNEGAKLSARKVLESFPQFNINELKKVLRAFNITKDCKPFAPHFVESHTEEELKELLLQYSVDRVAKSAKKDEVKTLTDCIKSQTKTINDLTNKKKLLEELCLSKFDIDSKIITPSKTGKSSLIIYLSDLHIGAYNNSEGYEILVPYSEEDITSRLDAIINRFANRSYEDVIVCNLGDSLDSYAGQTTRGSHNLPTLLTDKQQSKLYLKVMLQFFTNLVNNIHIEGKIYYKCIGESNHDGNWGWINNIALANMLENAIPNIHCYISDYPIDYFDVNGNTFIYLHGKDSGNQFKNFPLTIDPKTEVWFNNYIINNKIAAKKDIYVVKGDLHQYAVTCAKTFTYISVPSLYGSSNWIVANFQLSKWGVSFMEVSPNGNTSSGVISE